MRAVARDRYGEWPHIIEMDVPSPGDDEVLVRVVASSLNTADLDVTLGRPPISRLLLGPVRPRCAALGIDVAGVVEATGPAVSTVRPGDGVWGDVFGSFGAFADRVVAPARMMSRLPPGLGFEAAACAPHSGLLALQGLTRWGGVGDGARVLVNGAGGCVGPFAIQIAKACGAHVTAVDHPGTFELMDLAGADELVDHTTTDCTLLPDRFDLVLDIAANRSPRAYRRVLTVGGRVVLVARDVAGFVRAALVGGRRIGNVRWKPSDRDDLARLGDLMQRGLVTPIVDSTCRLDDVPEALARLRAGLARGKLVVTVGSA